MSRIVTDHRNSIIRVGSRAVERKGFDVGNARHHGGVVVVQVVVDVVQVVVDVVQVVVDVVQVVVDVVQVVVDVVQVVLHHHRPGWGIISQISIRIGYDRRIEIHDDVIL